MYQPKSYELALLRQGNTYTFADLVLKMHPDLCREAGFDFNDVVNHYKSRVDFCDDPIEPIFTLWGNNGVKYFFNCDMKFRGTKI